jgi:hypothetical protein
MNRILPRWFDRNALALVIDEHLSADGEGCLPTRLNEDFHMVEGAVRRE